MLKMQFITEQEILAYIEEQKIRQSKKYLTYSEREQLKKMIENPKFYVVPPGSTKNPFEKEILKGIHNISQPCELIKPGEDISRIIDELKVTLAVSGGLGLSANQIGYNKQISVISIFKGFNKEKKEPNRFDLVLINPKIIEHKNKFLVKGERCLSLPNISVDTDRWIYITLVNHNQQLEPSTTCYQDMEAIVIQHEVDHQRGKTIYDRKHKKR